MSKSTATTRARVVDEAEHSGKMEGLTVTEATKSDAARYVAGDFTTDELIERARRRYGLD